MNPKELICRMPQFEVKYLNENNWKKIPEKEFLLDLKRSFTIITPALERMFDGEEIIISSIKYRIRNCV